MMQTKLIKVGNSFGVRIPKGIVNQYKLEESNIEIITSSEGVLLKPVSKIPPLSAWDACFETAKKQGFKANEDLKQFEDWNNTLPDGEESL
jgi:antitoxin MazE